MEKEQACCDVAQTTAERVVEAEVQDATVDRQQRGVRKAEIGGGERLEPDKSERRAATPPRKPAMCI